MTLYFVRTERATPFLTSRPKEVTEENFQVAGAVDGLLLDLISPTVGLLRSSKAKYDFRQCTMIVSMNTVILCCRRDGRDAASRWRGSSVFLRGKGELGLEKKRFRSGDEMEAGTRLETALEACRAVGGGTWQVRSGVQRAHLKITALFLETKAPIKTIDIFVIKSSRAGAHIVC